MSSGISKRPWLAARVDKVELPTGVIVDEYYVLEYPDWVNTIAITKDGKSFLATGVEPLGDQHLDKGEDIEVRIFTRDEVYDLLRRGEMWQSVMAAPLWKYFALVQCR